MPNFSPSRHRPAPRRTEHSSPFARAFLLLLLACGATAAAGRAHAAATATPPVVSNDPEAAALPAARIDAALADYRRWLDRIEERNLVAGLATAVVVNDQVRFERTLGYADARSGEKVGPDTVFRIASLSKAFATALTGLLVRDGVLSWDTRLAGVLPFFKLKDAQASEQATVRDILGQRLGLPRNTYDRMLEDDVPYTELVRRLDEVDMACGVGACYGYQNVAFSLIGDVVYAKTGDFFYHQVEKRVFLPLGMHNATYGRESLQASRSWAHPHRRIRSGWAPFEPKDNFYVPPAAGVNASLRDMEQWLIAQMGGRPDVLPADLLEVLHAPVIATPSERVATPWRRARLKRADYALGWRVYDYAGETLVFHAGAVQGYRAMIGFLPKYHAGVVLMWNCESAVPSGLMPMLLDKMLGLPYMDWAGIDRPASRSVDPPRLKPKRKRRS
ncbi:penicillin-binding protein, beta-lactamase classC [Mizugakiibacter sediminis]|uniref:Penicillin-binding protein, beta-lactamase classC n=1 Tax=Mizugakiibacter sediminis TaxID=1475481 RepID=A0A0K8QM86_9GAMM|nr:serine hydrolase domain-containing protein [Mizugakiibacter sediminis]GAP65989.1 penicillin-binding protein, beta-lactamase classC [Mizugakiibacter sediminis]